jgi:dTDP-glucose pyrophosphorylase
MISRNNFEKLIVFKDEPLRQSIKKLNDAGEQILFIVDFDKHLCGVLTDGDLRRYILQEGPLDVHISQVMNKNFFSLKDNEKGKAHDLLKENKFNQIPIIDEKGMVIDLITSHDLFKNKRQNKEYPIVIMAGGKGSRLYPVTKIIPKPLIPVGDKTIIEIIIDNFKSNGFNQFYIILNYKKEMIKSYFAENQINSGITIVEEDKYMGTVGGLSLLKKEIENTCILSNCDILAKFNYDSMLNWHKEHKADFTILGLRKRLDVPYGVVKVNKDNYVLHLIEKPNYNFIISTGIYILEPSLLELIPDKTFYEMDKFIDTILKNGKKVTCYPIEDGWFDIGQFEEYKHLLKTFEI